MCLVQESERLGLVEIKGKGRGEGGGPEAWGLSYAHEGGPEGDRGRCWSDGLTLAGQGVSISPSKEYSGLISIKIDWFDLQGTSGSLLQYHSLKASILWHSAFFTTEQ